MADFATKQLVSSQYQQVKREIAQACSVSKRPRDGVELLAVSKRHSGEAIRWVYELGQRRFGENYVQEGIDKIQQLSDLDIEWHFIGPLQSNKTRAVSEHFDWLHTLEREKIAKRLNDQRPAERDPLNVLIQVNISQQDSKSGIALDQVEALAHFITQQPKLTLRGLMCIPAPLSDAELQQDFLDMSAMFQTLQRQYASVDTLSMGMSGDMSLAINCGSTMLRIGTAIFGQRAN